jgi:tRNA dimethylallyltransferase
MLLILSGPTACGKSAVAAALGRLTGGEVICADAFQLYAGLPVLTARPGPEELAAAPHHLYGSVFLSEDMDAARYARMAESVIAEVQSRGRLAIVTGGSGLYIKALTHGLSPLPPADSALRAELDTLPPEELIARLLTVDPGAAVTVNLSNPRYVQRALEIAILTGRPAAELKTSFSAGPRPGIRGIYLHRDRAEIYDRINRRTLEMIASGAMEEVRTVPPDISVTARKTIGLEELRRTLAGDMTTGDAVAAIQQTTRRYAKRQMTWFRRETWMETIDATGKDPQEIARMVSQSLGDEGAIPER